MLKLKMIYPKAALGKGRSQGSPLLCWLVLLLIFRSFSDRLVTSTFDISGDFMFFCHKAVYYVHREECDLKFGCEFIRLYKNQISQNILTSSFDHLTKGLEFRQNSLFIFRSTGYIHKPHPNPLLDKEREKDVIIAVTRFRLRFTHTILIKHL